MGTWRELGDVLEEVQAHAVGHWGRSLWLPGEDWRDYRADIKEIRIEFTLRSGLRSWMVVTGRTQTGRKCPELVYVMIRQHDDRYTTSCVSTREML